MSEYYLSIKNIDTTVLNYCGEKDKTASLLKVNGTISKVIFDKAVYIVEDGIVIKKTGSYPKCNVGQKMTVEQLELIESQYQKTTTKFYDTFEKISTILRGDQ